MAVLMSRSSFFAFSMLYGHNWSTLTYSAIGYILQSLIAIINVCAQPHKLYHVHLDWVVYTYIIMMYQQQIIFLCSRIGIIIEELTVAS